MDRLFRLGWFGAALSLAVTLWGMLIPAASLPDLPSDKLLHVIGFGAPTLLAAFASRAPRGLRNALMVIALAAIAGEAAQALVPGRTVSLMDLVADAVGMGIGMWLGRTLQHLFMRLAGPPPAQS
jgi:VanZ family protein